MSLDAAPLDPVPGLADEVLAALAGIMAPGPALADEAALLGLAGSVSDHLHCGRLTIADHDRLIRVIGDARMTLV